jgi:hypothetical protein
MPAWHPDRKRGAWYGEQVRTVGAERAAVDADGTVYGTWYEGKRIRPVSKKP